MPANEFHDDELGRTLRNQAGESQPEFSEKSYSQTMRHLDAISGVLSSSGTPVRPVSVAGGSRWNGWQALTGLAAAAALIIAIALHFARHHESPSSNPERDSVADRNTSPDPATPVQPVPALGTTARVSAGFELLWGMAQNQPLHTLEQKLCATTGTVVRPADPAPTQRAGSTRPRPVGDQKSIALVFDDSAMRGWMQRLLEP